MRIRSSLLILVAGLAVPLAALIAYDIYAEQRDAVRRTKDMLLRQADVLAANVSGKLLNAKAQLEHLARQRDYLRDTGRCKRVMGELHGLHPEYANIVFTNAAAEAVCSALPLPDGKRVDFRGASWYRKVQETKGFIVGQPIFGAIAGQAVLPLVTPIPDERGEVIGYVGITLPLKKFGLLVPDSLLPEGTRYGFLDETGVMVWRNVDRENLIGRTPRSEAARRIVEVRDGNFEERTSDGARYVFGVKSIPELGLLAFVSLPVDEVLAPPREKALRSGLRLALLVVLLLGVALTIARWIDRSVVGLARAARAVRDGHDEVRASVAGPQEIAAVATEFNALVDSRLLIEAELTRYRNELEQLVAERTASLGQANAEQQAIFDGANIGIAVMRDRVVLRCNHTLERMFGYEAGELTGRSTAMFYRSEADFVEAGRRLLADMAQHRSYRDEREVVRKDGSRFWARIVVRAVAPDELAQGCVGTLEDITAERTARVEITRALALAEEASRAKSAFLSNMSHELRTPLNAIIGVAQILQGSGLSPRQQDLLTKQQGASRQLLGLIDDILAYVRLDTESQGLALQPFKLRTLVGSVIERVRDKAAEKGLKLIVDIPADMPQAFVGDALQIGQVLHKLADNAVKFTESGELRLRVMLDERSGQDGVLRFEVRDTGIGIDADQQSGLFEHFHQTDDSLSRRYGGAGLGLAIARRLVELMGGAIGVDSEKGKGSRFWFTVGVRIPEALPGPAAARSDGGEGAARGDGPEDGPAAGGSAIDRERLASVCEALRRAFEEGDLAARQIADENAPLLRSAFGAGMRPVEGALDNFDFDLALEALEQAMQAAQMR